MNMTDDPRKKINLRNPTHLFAVGFGSGLMPTAPGTWGSALATIIGAFLLHYMGWSLFLLLTIISFWIGCRLCDQTSQDMGVHDHGSIVWDEFVGIFITLLALPKLSFGYLLLAFLLFRLFDIWKPAPIKHFDEGYTNGFGIMIDDVLAGLYAFVVILLFRWIF
ncbi:phosphatidylglycerophosphatase [Actinobacillus delphinicola]|uniref:Phosphatidylglycerophosphatase A n=1 Tax=Actinobacillus delphinicola TaxID=51161 RepID=A0A448TW44_9PAST|nr:phosphatidylglycerophosphatase [Actinobacillus delphinicola]VEJ10166.1 phosphatidylglycerophosphatase A [Actinobacillus delphinicola]